MREIPKKARLSFAAEKARLFLLEHDVHNLPIDVKALIKATGKCILKSYSKKIQSSNKPLKEIIDELGTEDGITVLNPKTNKYIIIINDLIHYKRRITWTLAHELGHVVLNHLIDFDKTSLRRSGLTNDEYRILDDEADAFAAELLSPVIVMVLADWTTKSDLYNKCLLSDKAATNRSKSICAIQKVKNRYFSYEKALYNQFSAFVIQRHCYKCGNHIFVQNAKYCTICGSKTLFWKDGIDMKYPSFATDKNGKLKVCVNCNNEDFEDQFDYCYICGTPRINRCEGYAEEDGCGGYYVSDNRKGCGQEVPTNARYCPYCGEPTTFFNNGSLKPWNQKDISKPETFVNEIPF